MPQTPIPHQIMLKYYIATILLLCSLLFMHSAQAQESIIFSYEAFSTNDTKDWALIPVSIPSALPDSSPEKAKTILHILKSRKPPSYGNTELNNHLIVVDPQKCDYAPIIAAEVFVNFAWHSIQNHQVQCANTVIPYNNDFTQLLPVFPLYKALSSPLPTLSLVRLDEGIIAYSDFKARLLRKDKTILAEISKILKGDNRTAKAAIISVYPSLGFPKAEQSIAPYIQDKDELLALAAVRALKRTKNSKIRSEIKSKFGNNNNLSHTLQKECLQDADPELLVAAAIAEIQTDNAPRISYALSQVLNANLLDELSQKLPQFYKLSTPNFELLSSYLLEHGQSSALANHLADFNAPALLLPLAHHLLKAQDNTSQTQQRATAFILQHDAPPQAILALRKLRVLKPPAINLLAHGLYQEDDSLREQCTQLLVDADNEQAMQYLAQAAQRRPALAPYFEWALSQIIKPSANILTALKTQKDPSTQRALTMASATQLTTKTLAQLRTSAPFTGAALIALASTLAGTEWFQQEAKSIAYNNNSELKRDLAFSLRFAKTDLDELRHSLLKDADPTVVATVIDSIRYAQRSDLAAMLIQNAKSAPLSTRIATLKALPHLLSEKSEKSILAFVSNEAFDDEIPVKLAAISALSQIVILSTQADTQSNAMLSLALTAKDPNTAIANATLIALAMTQSTQAIEPIALALHHEQTLPSALEAIELFPTSLFSPALSKWIAQNPQSTHINKAKDLLTSLQTP